MATWDTAYVNNLPDSAFLYVESGGSKDADGKTTPRSLRHFPYRDAGGSVDLPHLRNALARIPQSSLPQSVQDRLTTKAQELLDRATGRSVIDDGFEVRSSEMWDDTRFTIDDEGNGFTMDGPMAVYGQPSRLLSELDLGNQPGRMQLSRFGRRTFREVIEPGAFHKSLSESPDIVLHYQHDERSLPLGRTKAGTLRFVEEAGMVRAKADLPDNEWGRPVRDAVKRGDIGGISFRMGHVIERWAKEKLADGYDGPVRHLMEVKLRREVSLVTFPGYDTPAAVRELAEDAALEPDALAEAFGVLRDPEARLTDEQHQLLQTAIATRVESPFIDPKLASMRDRLGPPPEEAPAG